MSFKNIHEKDIDMGFFCIYMYSVLFKEEYHTKCPWPVSAIHFHPMSALLPLERRAYLETCIVPGTDFQPFF